MKDKKEKELFNGNSYICGFCGKKVKNKPTLTLSVCKGMMGRDITNICEKCLDEIERKVKF